MYRKYVRYILEKITPEEIDGVLKDMDNGVDMALNYAKYWSKYCREILNFVQQRITLEIEHGKKVQKLVETTRLTFQDMVL